MTKRVAIVAGEASGDILGADLIRSLRIKWPDAEFFGIGGERMIAEGFNSRVDMERIAVMGFIEPLKRLRELLRIRRSIIDECLKTPPDVFIGIDAPDFNTNIELKLRTAGIKTVHYVSPSVWAWRKGRIKKIKKAVDLMLTLLPFEADFYREHDVPVEFVGHPLAYELRPLQKQAARLSLGLKDDGLKIALMPGSRGSEIAMMLPIYLETAQRLTQLYPDVQFLIPAANDLRQQEINAVLANYSDINVSVFNRNSRTVMSAADSVLLTSGTTALEAMLLGRSMVVAYRVGAMTAFILRRLVDTPYISLPNLIAGAAVVPELIQEEATPENLVDAVLTSLDGNQLALFAELSEALKQGGGEAAANAIVELCKH